MKSMAWILVVLMGAMLSVAGAETVYTLSEAIEYGLEHNPQVREAEFRTDGAQNDFKAARGGFLPRLSTGYTVNTLNSLSAKGPTEEDYLDQLHNMFQVNLSQVLYSGARIFNEYRRAEAQMEMYQAQEAMTRIRLVFDIETAFFRLMKAKADVAAAGDMVLRLESGLEAVEAFFAGQMVPWVQVLEMKSELLTARNDLAAARNRVVKEKAMLLSVLGMPPSQAVTFEGGLDQYPSGFQVPLEVIWQAVLEARPDLAALEKQKVMARKEADMALSRYHPRVSLNMGYYDTDRDYDEPGASFTGTFDRDQRNRYWQAGISVQWELFDGGTAWFSHKKFLDQVRALEQQIRHAENAIRAELEQSLLTIAEAARRITAVAETVEMGKEFYRSEKKRLEQGLSSTPSVLDAQARLTRLEADYNNARFDYQLAMAGLNYLVGELKPVEFNQN